MYYKYLNKNDNIKDHTIFLAWLFHEKSEHKLKYLPVFLLLREVLKFENIFLHEINNVNSYIKNDEVSIYIKLQERKLNIKILLSNEITIVFNNTIYNISFEDFFDFIHFQIYLYVDGYLGKVIIRVFLNESKLFNKIIYDKSFKSMIGRDKFKTNCKLLGKLQNKFKTKSLDNIAFCIMKECGEVQEYKELVKYQRKNKNISYGSIFNKHSLDIYGYKLNMVKLKKPSIISMGSSRAHPFKENYFNKSFYNCSYTMTYLQEGLKFLQNTFKIYKPKIILMSIEFWWFNPSHYGETPYLPLHTAKYHFDVDYLNKFFEYYDLGYIDDKVIGKILQSKKYNNNYTSYENIGLRAIETSEGYLDDGYYLYSKGIFDGVNYEKRQEEYCENEVNNNSFHFIKASQIDKSKYELFIKIVELCKNNNVKLVSFMSPVSQKLYNRLNLEDYKYVNIIRDKLKKDNRVEFYDFLSANKLHSSKFEFFDCYHGGDVTYMRLLKYLYKKSSSIQDYINTDYIDKSILKNKDKIIEESSFFKKNEYTNKLESHFVRNSKGK